IEDGGPHGTACAEIILDVAPQANLYLYSCGTISEFSNAVNRALSKNVNIISCSLGMKNVNGYDGTGLLCDIVNNARAQGVLFVVAAGNEAEHHYEGTYHNLPGYNFHDFGGGDVFLSLGYLTTGTWYCIELSWNDWPFSDQDYDLYLWAHNHSEIVDFSINLQTGSQPPTEEMFWYTPYSDYFSIVIARYSATQNVYLELYETFNDFLEFNHPESSLTCPADASGAMTVGATYWQNDNIESFSSRGPTNDGRIKPDVTAPDGVSTYTYGNGNFYGTSASAPHVAGAAALLLSIGPSFTANDLQNRLETKANDLGPTGKDNLYGSGRINLWTTYNYIIPKANFTYTPLNPTTADTIQFTDTSTDSDGTIISWSWNFGDGYTSSQRNPTHNYMNDGTYNVILNVTDDDGAKDTKYKIINVTNLPPIANFTYSPSSITTIDTVQFNDTSIDNDGAIVSWYWNFGDGSNSTSQNTSHKYAYKGTYIVNLTVTDDDGATNSKSRSILVNNTPPQANFTYYPDNPEALITLNFIDTSVDTDGTIKSWSWNFGDGNTSNLQNPTHKYLIPGNYSVSLTVTDNDSATDIETKTISV
ncbi:MAG: PKD domain-containing protein, partial [Candidatus Thermoplasmatota archaeon]|nr:PKD domain-containing protein [Candidatus Thermoplasmatota archaeon]